MRTLTALMALAPLISGAAPERTQLVEQALDQIVRLEAREVPIMEAFAALTTETGVDIAVAPETIGLLPYGSDTRVSLAFENISLREGLSRLLLPMGMTFKIASGGVRVDPTPALLRIGRRATWAELDQLALVRDTDWFEAAQNLVALRSQRIQFRVEVEDPWGMLAGAIDRVGAGPGDQVLTLACRSLTWSWFPEDDKIVVLSSKDQIRRQLQAPVSMRCTHRPLVEVLQELARTAHVPIRHEPGALASLPMQTRQSFSLLAEGITVGEAVEQIAAATGLGTRIDDDAVVFYHPGGDAGPPPDVDRPNPALRDPYVAKLALPAEPGEVQVEILIRESELSSEALEARRELVRKADEILRLEVRREQDN